MGNVDWPQNNIKIYKSDSTNNRYRFCTIDLEGCLAPTGFVDCTFDHIEYLLNQDPNDQFIHIWREYEDNKKPHSWRVWPYSESKGWCDRIETVIAYE